MKFVIIKVILSLTILTLCINEIYTTKTKTSTSMQIASGIGISSNYKMTLGNLISKSHNKVQTNSNSEENLYNSNEELDRLSAPVREISGSQIFFKGWMKYFKYTDSKNNQKPKQFFRNINFEKEARKKKGNNGEKNVIIYF